MATPFEDLHDAVEAMMALVNTAAPDDGYVVPYLYLATVFDGVVGRRHGVGHDRHFGQGYMFLSFFKTVLWVMAITVPFMWWWPEAHGSKQSWAISTPALVGGLLFGMGAALNKGCAFSTLSRLGDGNLSMLVECGLRARRKLARLMATHANQLIQFTVQVFQYPLVSARHRDAKMKIDIAFALKISLAFGLVDVGLVLIEQGRQGGNFRIGHQACRESCRHAFERFARDIDVSHHLRIQRYHA